MLETKQDYVNLLAKIIRPTKPYFTEGKAGIVCGANVGHYGLESSKMEAFSRLLWGLAPLWAQGGEIDDFSKIYLEGIRNGTDPDHPEYWGELFDFDQKIVETAAIGLALILAPDKIWEPLSQKGKDNLYRWLMKVNEVNMPWNNWQFFCVMVNLGLKSVGMPYDKERVALSVKRYHSYYVGHGWYKDGANGWSDYYVAWAIHFYSLMYAKVMKDEDPENSNLFLQRAEEFGKTFVYWFAEDGSALAFGRSLTYRFAQVAFWSACVYVGVYPLPLGVMKGIISRNLEFWMKKPIFDNGGILSIGYGYPNVNVAEHYNAFGSPYWGLKCMLILALPEDHPFFREKALPLPELDNLKVIPEARMILQRLNGDVYAYPAMLGGRADHGEMQYKYGKIVYSSRYAFSIPRMSNDYEYVNPDNSLTFYIDPFNYAKHSNTVHEICEDGTICFEWSPCRGVEVKSRIIPTEKGHKRIHTVRTDKEIVGFDSGLSVPHGSDPGSVVGDGEYFCIKTAPNTNLMDPHTDTVGMKYVFPVGETTVTTEFVYPDHK